VNMPLLVALLGCTTLFLFMYGLYTSISSRQTRESWHKRATGVREQTAIANLPAASSPQRQHLAKFLGVLGEASKPKDAEELSHVRQRLIRAGYRHNEAPVILYGIKLCGTILFPILFALFRIWFLSTLPSMQTLVLFVLSALVGFYLPDLLIQISIRHRQQKILEGFPDALDLMVVCVEAGLGLDAAIDRVGEELKLSHKILSEEFRLLSLELRAGQSRHNALRSLSSRVDLEDVQNLVTLLIQTDRFGTSIAQTLRIYSDSMRVKRHQRAEEMAAKLPVKLLLPLIFFIFPSLFVVILGPAVIQIIRILIPTLSGN
jgi:tight adherence protein C